ncbi:hypothetical protein Q5425_44785 [Amycolatopsis sp. A133]|uniref:hypothetical protein n=1 Tax=Amycolatopsis sp. A133 TaxID=3064472 RepID=UPI0027F623EF|nr:hypothetical protein [Amycolatopsis sp. A133]MDQ7810884.1 hypothetical protein [Amycolatopsis sp. A133]
MTSTARPRAEAFAVDRRGPDLLIRRPGEAEPPGRPALVPGHAFVRVSAAAAAEPALVTALPSLLHRHVVAGGDVRTVRIGVPDLGADALVPQALADALDVEILAPEGDFCADPGAALYAAGGWRRFRPGASPSPGGHRHPVPPWEAGLPAEAITVGGVVLEPVPAGVRVRGAAEPPAAPDGPAFAVPADPAAAAVVVGAGGRVPPPADVAAAAARLPEGPTRLVVLPSAARTSAWLSEFAKALGRDVVVAAAPAAGRGEGRFGPFASLLRQRPDGGQEVAEAAPPPGRWRRRGRTGYRLGAVEADVVPSGLALRTGRPDPAADRAPSDPRGWTLHLGTPGERLTPELLAAAEEILGELTPQTRAAAWLRLAGTLDDGARALLSARPSAAVRGTRAAASTRPRTGSGLVPGFAAAQGMPRGEGLRPAGAASDAQGRPRGEGLRPAEAASEATVRITRPPQSPAPAGTPAESKAPAGERPQPGPLAPPSLLVSGPPVSTVSGAPAPPPETKPETKTETKPAEAEPAEPPAAEPAPPAETPVAEPPVVSGRELVVADRASTPAEQARFTAAAGEAYGEALATVNAALATWPSMRQEEAVAKADYVAVCLYLGGGAGSSADLGAAVRAGSAGELDGQLPCLVSGLRRLPTHRRAVLRQGRAGQPPEGTAAPGTVLTEPGFLVGSTDLDVTVPDAGLDVLIWPASARRTSELRIGPPVNEVVFFAGARFKALAVRTVPPDGEPADDTPAAPRVAALFRELAPGEQAPASGELDERDLAALAKLDQALDRRRRGALRVVDEPDVVARMTTSLLEWRADTTARATANHTATLAS